VGNETRVVDVSMNDGGIGLAGGEIGESSTAGATRKVLEVVDIASSDDEREGTANGKRARYNSRGEGPSTVYVNREQPDFIDLTNEERASPGFVKFLDDEQAGEPIEPICLGFFTGREKDVIDLAEEGTQTASPVLIKFSDEEQTGEPNEPISRGVIDLTGEQTVVIDLTEEGTSMEGEGARDSVEARN